jgi:hypothetical protein
VSNNEQPISVQSAKHVGSNDLDVAVGRMGRSGVALFGFPPILSRYRVILFVVGNSLTLGLPVVAVSALFGRTGRGIAIWAGIAAVLLILALAIHVFTGAM